MATLLETEHGDILCLCRLVDQCCGLTGLVGLNRELVLVEAASEQMSDVLMKMLLRLRVFMHRKLGWKYFPIRKRVPQSPIHDSFSADSLTALPSSSLCLLKLLSSSWTSFVVAAELSPQSFPLSALRRAARCRLMKRRAAS